jgi:hypothetical protein
VVSVVQPVTLHGLGSLARASMPRSTGTCRLLSQHPLAAPLLPHLDNLFPTPRLCAATRRIGYSKIVGAVGFELRNPSLVRRNQLTIRSSSQTRFHALDLRKPCPEMPRDAWESLHGGSRKWFPEQHRRSAIARHRNGRPPPHLWPLARRASWGLTAGHRSRGDWMAGAPHSCLAAMQEPGSRLVSSSEPASTASV